MMEQQMNLNVFVEREITKYWREITNHSREILKQRENSK